MMQLRRNSRFTAFLSLQVALESVHELTDCLSLFRVLVDDVSHHAADTREFVACWEILYVKGRHSSVSKEIHKKMYLLAGGTQYWQWYPNGNLPPSKA